MPAFFDIILLEVENLIYENERVAGAREPSMHRSLRPRWNFNTMVHSQVVKRRA